VQDDERGFHALRELEGFERVTDGQFAFARLFGGELIEIGRGKVHAHGQGTKIVQGGNPDFAGVHRFEDAGHQADARAVAQFGKFKPKLADLAQHGASIGMAVRIPAGGKRIHAAKKAGCGLNLDRIRLREFRLNYMSA
jgi:hypothetical protein